MTKLLIEKKYDILFDLFLERMPHIREESYQPKNNESVQLHPLHSLFSVAFEALLFQVIQFESNSKSKI